jgi:hypothetical protein
MYVCIMYVCMYVLCTYVCMYVCVYVYMYVCLNRERNFKNLVNSIYFFLKCP